MKLIIDIPEERFEGIRWAYKGSTQCDYLYRIVANGTPLDEVIGKIEKLNPVDYGSIFSYESHNGAKDMQRDVLQILDNIGKAESEDT